MTPNEFRSMALSFPDTVESAHMGHPDFRAGGRIFATLGYPQDDWGMVKLTPDQQNAFVKAEPEVFSPVKGGWGRQGATMVRLGAAKKTGVRKAMTAAWQNVTAKAVAGQKPRKAANVSRHPS